MRRTPRPWTHEDDAQLTELAATTSDVVISRIMDRSTGLIATRRKRLGLTPCAPKPTVQPDTVLLQAFLSDGWTAEQVERLSRWIQRENLIAREEA